MVVASVPEFVTVKVWAELAVPMVTEPKSIVDGSAANSPFTALAVRLATAVESVPGAVLLGHGDRGGPGPGTGRCRHPTCTRHD